MIFVLGKGTEWDSIAAFSNLSVVPKVSYKFEENTILGLLWNKLQYR